MRKIIYENPVSSEIVMREVSDSGGIGLGITAIWDEKDDGRMPALVTESNLAGIERSGSSLVLNQSKLDDYNAAKEQEESIEAQRSIDKTLARTKMATILDDITAASTIAQLKPLMKDLFRMIKHKV